MPMVHIDMVILQLLGTSYTFCKEITMYLRDNYT